MIFSLVENGFTSEKVASAFEFWTLLQPLFFPELDRPLRSSVFSLSIGRSTTPESYLRSPPPFSPPPGSFLTQGLPDIALNTPKILLPCLHFRIGMDCSPTNFSALNGFLGHRPPPLSPPSGNIRPYGAPPSIPHGAVPLSLPSIHIFSSPVPPRPNRFPSSGETSLEKP